MPEIRNVGKNPFAEQKVREEPIEEKQTRVDLTAPKASFSFSERIFQFWDKITHVIAGILPFKSDTFLRGEKLYQTRQLSPNYQKIPSAMKIAKLLGEEVLSSPDILKLMPTKRQINLEKANKIDFSNSGELLPLVMEIGVQFGADKLKGTPQETIFSLVENVSEEDLQRDCNLFNCTPEQMKVKYAERLVRANQLGITPSEVTQIENIWRLKMQGAPEQQKIEEFPMGKHSVVFIPSQKKEAPADLYVYTDPFTSGSFKAAHHAFSFFNANQNLILLAPIKKEAPSDKSEAKRPEARTVEAPYLKKESVALGTTEIKEDISSDDDRKNLAEIWAAKQTISLMEEKPEVDEEEKALNEFRKEAAICEEVSGLPGIWKTHKVTEVNGKVCIISEPAGYILQDHDKPIIELNDLMKIYQDDRLPIQEQIIYLKMVRDSLEGFQSLHEKGIVHFDIKPQNVLCSREGKAGVSDFGTSCKKERIKDDFEPIGSPTYVAPEVSFLAGNRDKNIDKVSEKADIWSIGICLWELISGEVSEEHPSLEGIISNPFIHIGYLAKPGNARTKYETNYTEPADKSSMAHLVWQCTRPNPEDRPSMKEVLQKYDTWLKTTLSKLQSGQVQSIKECFA